MRGPILALSTALFLACASPASGNQGCATHYSTADYALHPDRNPDLFQMVERGRFEEIDRIVKSGDVHDIGRLGYWSIMTDHGETLVYLAQLTRSHSDARELLVGWLGVAAGNQCPRIARILLHLGADPNLNAETFDPLAAAISTADEEIVKILLNEGHARVQARHLEYCRENRLWKILTLLTASQNLSK